MDFLCGPPLKELDTPAIDIRPNASGLRNTILKLEGKDRAISTFVNLDFRDFDLSCRFRQIVTKLRGWWFPLLRATAQTALSSVRSCLPSSDLIAAVLDGMKLSQSFIAFCASKSVCVSVTKTFVFFGLYELVL
jgi:hypothetical protein